MRNIAKLGAESRQELFTAAANKMNVSEAIIEKDFWVCFTLDYLFHHCKWKNAFAFKGGTSLSKAYNLIERFSEDIDLILDWRVLGYGIREPWEERSNTKQQKFLDDAKNRLFRFLKEDFMPEFENDMRTFINEKFTVYISDDDSGTVRFVYPHAFSDTAILSEIRLEIGAMAAWTPTQYVKIKPYCAEIYPQVFEKTETTILTTTPERTFWEKATILHQEALRPKGSMVPIRYSRHYYDLFCMSNSSVKDAALNNPMLLQEVSKFKAKFYPRKWARYDLAKAGTIKLMPAEHSIEKLKEDYRAMQSMIYGIYPSFDEILKTIRKLENEINCNE